MNWISAISVLAADPGSGEIIRILDGVRVFLTAILTALSILALTYAGIRYVMAVGDPAGVERAKFAAKLPSDQETYFERTTGFEPATLTLAR